LTASVGTETRSIDFAVATGADDADLRALLRQNPMAGEISVAFTREPDALAAGAISGEPHHTIIARDRADGRAVGMGSRSVYDAFFGGKPCRIGYLSQLRIGSGYRGRAGLLSEGYRLIQSLRRCDELPFDLTTIVSDNRPALRVLEAGLRGVPAYRKLDSLTTAIVPLWRHRSSSRSGGVRIETASIEQLDGIAQCLERNHRRYQFAPRWRASDLTGGPKSRGLTAPDFLIATVNDRLAGCFALWDQSSFKQIVVDSYGPTMRRLNPCLRLVSKVARTPALPEPGHPISYVFGSHIAVDDDRPEVFESLFREACNEARARGHACLILGFASRHPFLQVIRRICRAWTYSSIVYAVCWDGERAPGGIEEGRTHLEVALL
jgi:hypothetical protein